jgi:hypothetical protein
MRSILQTALLLGLFAATAIGNSFPVKAQEISFYGPGAGIEIITRPHHHRHARFNGLYGGLPYAHQYTRGIDGRYAIWVPCPPAWTIQNGVCKPTYSSPSWSSQ